MNGKIVGTMKLADIERMRLEAKQEGRREVVKTVESFCSIIREGMYGEIWQAKLKEWGIE